MVRGSYAEYAIVPLSLLVALPDGVEMRVAAAALLQGLTAHYLVHSTYPVKKGNTLLVHAAGGATGLLVVQMAKRLGATVYGTASTDEKLRLAQEAGADEVIQYTKADFEREVMRLTDGDGLDVVYDSVGQATFDKGLDCLKARGMMVLFGQASGPVPPFDLRGLMPKSLFVTRPSLGNYVADRSELERRADELFSWILNDSLKIRIGDEFPLSEAAEAHRQLQDRSRVGKLLLIP
jgi:NADPH2:quinone reductase